MRCRPCVRSLLSHLIALALLAGATAPGAGAVAAQYPTDGCVAEKLRAAGRYCGLALKAGGDEAKLAGARKALAGAFGAAERRSAQAGVACDQTTVTAGQMADLLGDAAAELVASVEGEGACRERRIVAAGAACHALLDAEGQHLVLRSRDRERKVLAKRQQLAVAKLEASWATCSDGEEPPTGAVESVVREAFLASVVSPHVSTEWTMIEPPAQVPYGDEVLEPICSRGTPWVYFTKRGTVNKLLVYYQGGGACWNYLTCQPFVQTFKSTAGPSDNPANATTGFADFRNPENPFKDWNVVFVPYCTGDVHWGNATVNHEFAGNTTLIHHKGRVNAAVAEKFAREHFVSPDQVFVTGSSAGSYGAIVNGIFLQEKAYPSAPFAVVGDAGNGVITREFLENDLAKWGIEDNLPRWIPGLDVPLSELEASDLWTEAARTYPNSRWANYTTAYDGGTGGQVGFYNIMKSGSDLAQFLLWWRPSCEWNEEMRRLVQESAGAAPDNYRYYIGTGSRHTMWGHDKVYTDTTGGVPTVVSWLRAMLDGTPDWTNVECADCGALLPGDPRPDRSQFPVSPPYEDDPITGQRVVCQ